jgi:hypothetical protein
MYVCSLLSINVVKGVYRKRSNLKQNATCNVCSISHSLIVILVKCERLGGLMKCFCYSFGGKVCMYVKFNNILSLPGYRTREHRSLLRRAVPSMLKNKKEYFRKIFIIIIISPPQSTAGHRPLQLLAISLDLRLLESSSRQPSCANRHSTWREGGLHYVYRDATSTLRKHRKIHTYHSRFIPEGIAEVS